MQMETEKSFNYIFYTSDDMCRAPCVCVCMHEMYLVGGGNVGMKSDRACEHVSVSHVPSNV